MQVRPGDCLTTIAARVGENWHQLYADNRAVIGADPNLILTGQELRTVGTPITAPLPVVTPAPAAHATAGYADPLPGMVTLSQGFHLGSHNGIDMAAPKGTPIYAATGGTVTVAGLHDPAGFGAVVYITDDDGTVTWYGHVDTWLVHAGQHVAAGQQIATVGNRGDSYGASGGYHLHFEVHVGPGPINPVTWLAGHGIRL